MCRQRGLSQRDPASALGRSERWVSRVGRDVLPVERTSVLQPLAHAWVSGRASLDPKGWSPKSGEAEHPAAPSSSRWRWFSPGRHAARNRLEQYARHWRQSSNEELLSHVGEDGMPASGEQRATIRPRHTIEERPWVVRGTIHIRRHSDGEHTWWYAEDDEGVVALSESREELEHVLREEGHETPDLS